MPRRKRLPEGAAAPVPPLQFDPERANIRLEVLKLAHRHDLEPARVIDRASELTAWVFGEQPADKA